MKYWVIRDLPSTLFIYNFWVAAFLFLGIIITVPFFLAADWAKDIQDITESQWKRRERVPTIFNAEFIVDYD